MKSLTSLYHRFVPDRVRVLIWQARTLGPTTVIRSCIARLRVFFGQPIACVSLDAIRLLVDLRDEGVGRPIYVTRSYEPSETAILKETLRPGMTVVDIGANIGLFTVLSAKLVGESGCIISIEPDPHNFGVRSAPGG